MAALPESRRTQLTVDQYLALDAEGQIRHEYYQGAIIAMTGARRNHVDPYERAATGWLVNEYTALTDMITIRSLAWSVPLAEACAKVQFNTD